MLEGNGLNERVVMGALNRARRRFYLRPGYIARHLDDVFRVLASGHGLAWKIVKKTIVGQR
jgi:hypothetical protein